MKAHELSSRNLGQRVAWTVTTDDPDEPDQRVEMVLAGVRTHRVTGAVEVTDKEGRVDFLPTEWDVTVAPV